MPRALVCICGDCKRCKHRVYMRAYYHSSPERKEKTKALVRKRYFRLQDTDPVWREKERARNRKRLPPAISTPEKNKARWDLKNAVRAGKVIKPDNCSVCHEVVIPARLHGHHPDHTKPLEVIWLCNVCHGREHRRA